VTTTSGPLVSVVIPAYNAEAYLAEAIDSVLPQWYTNTEIIVVDDGSTDGTGLVAQNYGGRVRYIRRKNGGIGAARNTGVEHAHGSLLAFLDADDLWTPEKLALQLAVMAAQPDVDLVFGHVVQFQSGDGVALPEGLAHPAPGFSAGTMLVRMESFHRVGPFTTDFKLGEFIDWYARAKEIGLIERMLPGIVLRRRYHESNTGRIRAGSRGDYARVLKAALDRRRAGSG
jgi:glycosyltransferase involved in cell wall biosynthesis